MGLKGERKVGLRAERNDVDCNEHGLSFCKGVRRGVIGAVSTIMITAVMTCTTACAQELAYPNTNSFQRHATGARSGVDAGSILEKLKLLCFYQVKDGNLQQSIVPRESLELGQPIKVDGYVCGIVAFCEQEMGISVNGQAMSRIMKNGDGSFSLKRFGTMKPEDFSIVRSGRAYYGELSGEGRSGAILKSGYSLFPEVVGDSVANGNRFQITLNLDGKSITLPVEQQGYVDVRGLPLAGSDSKGEILAFRYLGTRLASLQQEGSDFDGRLQAIAAGVSNIKQTLGANLIQDVNIVDYGDVYNAVTSNSGDDMWFYSTAFRKEPVVELKTIAEHETLHRFVSRIGFTSDSALRELFADLRGFDEYSYERFLTVTTGQTPIGRSSDAGSKHSVFFSFVNEKNFLEKMKGGHSHANIDEFCASFVHSLMYVDRLEGNLNRAIQCRPSEGPRYLTLEEKSLVLNDYMRTVQAMRDSIANSVGSERIPTGHINAILKYAFNKATDIKARLQTVSLASAQESISAGSQYVVH